MANRPNTQDPEKFNDFSVYKRVPNLDNVRLNRLRIFNFIGIAILCINAVVWSIIWANLGYPVMTLFSLVFLPFSYYVYRLTTKGRHRYAFNFLLFGAAVWIMAIVFAASGPGQSYGGSVHSYYLTLAAIVYFAFIGQERLKHVGITIVMFMMFLLFEFFPIDFVPIIQLAPEELQQASSFTWFSAISTFFIFYFWLAKDIHDVEQKLNYSNSRMEELLENILPPTIAKKLSEDGKTFAEGFSNCSVLFADIVNFTEMSKRNSPEKIVKILNEVFIQFDDATQRHGVEKVKTIGDAYMVSAGVPSLQDDHAIKLVELAQEFLSILDDYKDINIRIGINSGPVTAGIIGKRKFLYDLWGDTVNIAARMEQYGLISKIHISESTYQLVKAKFDCTSRGEIDIKGLGTVRTYIVD